MKSVQDRLDEIAGRVVRGGKANIDQHNRDVAWLQRCTGQPQGRVIVNDLGSVATVLSWKPGVLDVLFLTKNAYFQRVADEAGMTGEDATE